MDREQTKLTMYTHEINISKIEKWKKSRMLNIPNLWHHSYHPTHHPELHCHQVETAQPGCYVHHCGREAEPRECRLH